MDHRNLLRSTIATLGLGLLAGSGCASKPAQTAARSGSRPPTEVAAVPSTNPRESLVEAPLPLLRSPHAAPMSEVVLEPGGQAALTLDVDGGVRLWTELDASTQRAPLALPAQEPSWMSLAQAQGGFVAGFVDTAGGARVVRVDVDGDGARLRTAFELPATEPLFELHVLDGGERILTLGIDHRVRLYDAEGVEISGLDATGFVPWQLRVQQPVGGSPAIVAVLAGPTRVQSIALEGDRLLLRGEPHTVEIDQGPNRNDLSLTPDGRTVVAMRRPRARKRRFTFELVDLESGSRRLIAAEVDTRDRPRVLLVGGDRALLESGSGAGLWLDLSAAVPWAKGTTREETEEVPAVATKRERLPGSTASRRMHVALAAGVRAVPAGEMLIADPVDTPQHVRLGAAPLRPRAVALDEHGARVAWAMEDSIVLEGDDEAERASVTLPRPGGAVEELAFVGTDGLLVLDHEGHAAIIDDQHGRVLASTRLPVGWGLSAAGFRRGDAFEEGTLALLPGRPKDPIRVVDVGDGEFGRVRDVPRQQRGRWPQLGTGSRDAQGVIEALGFAALSSGSIGALVEDRHGGHLIASDDAQPTLYRVSEDETRSIPLREGQVQQLRVDPSGSKVAVIQRIHRADVFDESGRVADLDRHVVSVYDVQAERRLWSWVARNVVDVDWSHDGGRLAVAAFDGGRVIDARTGEALLVRQHLGMQRAEHADTESVP
ncbi:MAG: hypothetical protein KDK70_24010 [Myxococcales bacterium]|nr:hypothetical protein [Myxococcales bacterium]